MDAEHRDRSRILAAIGVLLLLIGVACAALGPAEMYCFYLFSEGGPFHYEGFGFGSFMFGNIAVQIMGYYLIALVCIPLGYGHLKLRRWARTLAVTLLYAWLVLGVPLIFVFLFILFSSKNLSFIGALVALLLSGLSYLLLPVVLLRFYQGRDVRLTFETSAPEAHRIERLPQAVLVLCALFLFYTVSLHVLILFRGMFPLSGFWLFDLEGILAIDGAVLVLFWLTWGVFRQRPWAWWGALAYFVFMTMSWTLTLSTSKWSDLLSRLSFPPTEVEALQGLPLEGFHFAPLVGIPLVLTVGVILLSRRRFRQVQPKLP